MQQRYFKQSTLDDPAGTGVSVTMFSQDDNGDWLSVQRDAAGNPHFGYLAEEISHEDYLLWQQRIAYPDMVAYFPGVFPGVGVVDANTYQSIRQRHVAAARDAQVVTPRQARQWLIEHDLDEALEAGILAIGSTGLPADVKRAKLMWNWYEKADSWVYGNAFLGQAFQALGIDKDQFFAEAKQL